MRFHKSHVATNVSKGFAQGFLHPVSALGLRLTVVCQTQYIGSLRWLKRRLYSQPVTSPHVQDSVGLHLWNLPQVCPGCGAYAQNVNSADAGFYSGHRRSVKKYLARQQPDIHPKELEPFARTAGTVKAEIRSQLGLKSGDTGKPN